jgi:glycosyltransferase involved in cell wall biosynthesis
MEYSVIIPVYNSQNSLEELYKRINNSLQKMSNDFEVIFVDDYSSDESWKVLNQIKSANKNSNLKIISFAKNYGQHNATMCGFRHSKGDIVITLDDDLQHNPADISLLVDALRERKLDVIFGVPENYQYKKGYRKYASMMWKFGTHKINDAIENASSFRVIKREIIDKVSSHRQQFIFIDEMLSWYTDVIDSVKVKFNETVDKKSGYNAIQLFFLMLNLGIFYSSVPLKIMTYGGLLMSFFSFLLGLNFMYKKIFIGVPIQGYTSLMVAILFSTSLLLICLGIIGQYLGKIYTVLNNKPTYSIKEQYL